MLFAASGAKVNPRARAVLIVFTIFAQTIVLHAANAHLRPPAESIAAIDTAQGPIASRAGAFGLMIEDIRPFDASSGLSFDPYLWAGVNIFRHDNSVLANTPWLDLAIIPLGATPRLPASAMKPEGLEFPSILRQELAADPGERDAILRSVDFLLIEQAYRRPATGLDPILGVNASAGWQCRTIKPSWIRICNKHASELR